jgi:hypothetical protein
MDAFLGTRDGNAKCHTHRVRPGPASNLKFGDKKWNSKTRAHIKHWAKVKGHCKDESYTEAKPLRLINARSDFAKGLLGPICSAIEHKVCKLPWFVKYISVKDRPGAIIDRCFVEGATYTITDYTSFEAHFTREVMWAIEQPMYEFMCQNLPADQRDMFMSFWKEYVTGKNIIDLSGHLQIKLLATRMSGEMMTSLANGWSNLIITMFAIFEKGASWNDMFNEEIIAGFVEGDDGIFRLPPHLTPTTEEMASYGFCLKMEQTDDLTEASFCGMIFDVKNRVVVADPIKVLMKIGWAGRKYLSAKQSTLDEIALSKAQSALYQYNGCPIVTPACNRIIKVLKQRGAEIGQRAYAEAGSYKEVILREAVEETWTVKDVQESTRELIYKLYGLSPDDQIRLEKQLSTWEYGDKVTLEGLPQTYSQYALAFQNYVEFPTESNDFARKQHYHKLRILYALAGTHTPTYRALQHKSKVKSPP